ncbi:MAG: YdcF family protein [Bacteroidota bacterium]
MGKFFKKLLIFLSILLVVGFSLFLLRFTILKGIGYSLIYEDPNVEVDAAFVLSSSPNERCEYAAELYHLNLFPLVITMGESVNPSLLAMNIQQTDAQLARTVLIRSGVDSTAIRVINRGSSTFEESEQILGYATREGFQSIMIISSQFHTRRIKKVFKKKFKQAGIDVVIKGAPPKRYEVDHWWENEEAMINVNNEYVKLLYYGWKY